jgi:hypothetical protein
VASGLGADPGAEAGAAPFEAVVAVAQAVGGHAEAGVEVTVRRGDHDEARREAAQHGGGDGGEAVGRDVLDGLDQRCGVDGAEMRADIFGRAAKDAGAA